MIILVENSRANYVYKDIRDRHYVTNNGCIGRQIHYLIFESHDFASRPIGIISGASPVWGCRPRDQFFGITKENRNEMLNQIVNNVVFRLEKNIKNIASQTLALWRKQITKDWYKKYNFKVKGFETFVYGTHIGSIYKADNWKEVGLTAGYARHKPHGIDRKSKIEPTPKKLIFCK